MVFYGSQTGTGEEFAGRLAKEGIRYRMKGMVADPEECDMVSCYQNNFYKKKNSCQELYEILPNSCEYY